MSVIAINFLKDRRKKLTKQQLLDMKLFRAAGAICLACFVLFIAAVGVRLLLAYQLDQQKKRENQLLVQIRSQEDNEEAYVIFAAKLKVLAALFEQRQDKQEALQYFTTLFGSDILVNDVAYDSEDNILTLGLQAADIFSLQSVFDQLQSEQVKDQFLSVAASDLRRNDQGQYQTNITVQLQEPQAPAAASTETPESADGG